MEKACAWLFGESKWAQEKKLKKLLIITAPLVILALILLIDGPDSTRNVFIVILLIWGWGPIRATMTKVAGFISFFDNDIGILIFTLMIWFLFGIAAGAISLLLGVIRFIQLKRE